MCIQHNIKPCNECPFRRNSLPGWLGQYNIPGILQWFGLGMSFPCHKTMTHDDKGFHRWTPKEKHCGGALIMLQKDGNEPNLYMKNRQLFKGIPDSDNIFSNLDEFVQHHEKYSKSKNK